MAGKKRKKGAKAAVSEQQNLCWFYASVGGAIVRSILVFTPLAPGSTGQPLKPQEKSWVLTMIMMLQPTTAPS